jgi:hypothetical protein
MKILAKDEEREYYSYVRRAGAAAAVGGFIVGIAATAGLHRYYPPYKHISAAVRSTFVLYPTLLATSYGSNYGCLSFQSRIHPETRAYIEKRKELFQKSHVGETRAGLAREWLYEHQLPVLVTTWAVSMLASLRLISRDPFQTGARKLVQARVLAQATNNVICATYIGAD